MRTPSTVPLLSRSESSKTDDSIVWLDSPALPSHQIESVEPVPQPENPSCSITRQEYAEWDGKDSEDDGSDEEEEFIPEVTVQEEEELEDL